MSTDADDGSLSYLMNKQLAISAKGGPKRIMIDEEEDEKAMNNHYDQEEDDDAGDDLSETEDEDTTSGDSKSPVQQQQQQQQAKKDDLFTPFHNEKAIQDSSQLPSMFQTDPDLLQREYYYSDDENYNTSSKKAKSGKPVTVEQVIQEVKNLDPRSGLLITEHTTLSNKSKEAVAKIKQLFQEAKFSDFSKKKILTPKVCKLLIFLIRIAPTLAQLSDEVVQQYPGLIARLNTYLQWSYGVMVNMYSLFPQVAKAFQVPLDTPATVDEVSDLFGQHGILEPYKALRIMRSWLEEIPKLYRFTMDQIQYLLVEIQADKQPNLTRAEQIRAQYRELRLYEASTIANTGNDFEEADNLEKHRNEIDPLSVEAIMPGFVIEDYKEALGDESSWAEDVSTVEYDYLTDGLGVYDFKRFWTPYPEEDMLENGLLDFLANLWEIQKAIGSTNFPNPTASQVFQFVAVPVAEDFRYTYDKLISVEDVYRQMKKQVKNPELKPLTVAIDTLLKRIHEGGTEKKVIPLDWIRPIVGVYRARFEDRIMVDSGKAKGQGITDAEGSQMMQELFYIDAYLNSIYRRFALVLFPRLLREVELDDRNAKKEAAKDKTKLAKNFGYQQQVSRDLYRSLNAADSNDLQSRITELEIEKKAFISSLEVYTQTDMVEDEKTDNKKNLKPGEMYRKHALSVVRELYETASVELIGLITDQIPLIEDVRVLIIPRYEYWSKQARAKKETELASALEEDLKQIKVVIDVWQDRVRNKNERLLGFLLHTFELSEGSNTLRQETMEDIINMLFELYQDTVEFKEGFQDALSPILKPKDLTELKKMMNRRSFADNKDSKLYKAYKNKERIRSSTVKAEPGTTEDDAMQDEEQKLTEPVRINELQSRIASAASTWAQQVDDQIDVLLESYQGKTGLQQVIANFRTWRKQTSTRTEEETISGFQHYLEEFKAAITKKKDELKDPATQLAHLQAKQQDLEFTLIVMAEDKAPETKQKEVKSEMSRIETDIKSLDPKERGKVEQRLLKFDKVINRADRNFNAAVGYLTEHPHELSWATVYSALGLVGVASTEEAVILPKRTVSNKFEKAEIKLRENETIEIDDDDDELEIEYEQHGIQLSDLAPLIVKHEPNSFHATDEVNTDELAMISSSIVTTYKPMTLEGKMAKFILTNVTRLRQSYQHLNEFNRPATENDYIARELEETLFAYHSMDDNISEEEARARAKQDVLQYMQSNSVVAPMAIEEEKKYAPAVKREVFENRKRPIETVNNINNIDDLLPLPTTLIRVETNENNQGFKLVPLSEITGGETKQQEPSKRQRIPKIATTTTNNNSNVKVVRKIPILPFISPAPLERVKNNDQMDTSGHFFSNRKDRKNQEEQEIYSLVRGAMFLLRLTPLGVSMLEDIFDGSANVPDEFDVVFGQEFKQGVPEECKFITSTLIQAKICIQNNLYQALLANRTQIEMAFDIIITESYNRNNEKEFEISYTAWSKRHSSNNFKDLTELERKIRQLYADYWILFAFEDSEGEWISKMNQKEYTQYKTVIYEAITELENELNQLGNQTGLQKLNEIPFRSIQTLTEQINSKQQKSEDSQYQSMDITQTIYSNNNNNITNNNNNNTLTAISTASPVPLNYQEALFRKTDMAQDMIGIVMDYMPSRNIYLVKLETNESYYPAGQLFAVVANSPDEARRTAIPLSGTDEKISVTEIGFCNPDYVFAGFNPRIGDVICTQTQKDPFRQVELNKFEDSGEMYIYLIKTSSWVSGPEHIAISVASTKEVAENRYIHTGSGHPNYAEATQIGICTNNSFLDGQVVIYDNKPIIYR